MVVYWDIAALLNGAVDYLLLLATARIAGRTLARGRLLAAAALGGVYGAAQLFLPQSLWLLASALLALTATAFAGTGRAVKLGLLFTLLACSLGGAAVLLGRACGSLDRVARGVVYAELPWGVLLGAAGATYFLLSTVFRGGARGSVSGNTVTARFTHGGRSVTLRLLRDSGALLTDPVSGASVPVIGERALRALLPREGYITLPITTATGAATLRAFRCERVSVNGHALGDVLVAIAPELYGDEGFQGVWALEALETLETKEARA